MPWRRLVDTPFPQRRSAWRWSSTCFTATVTMPLQGRWNCRTPYNCMNRRWLTASAMTRCSRRPTMLRDEILALMEALKLRGMQAVLDEVLSSGRKQKAIPEKVILELLKAEAAER